MAATNIGYELLQNSAPKQKETVDFVPDRMMPVSTMHRMALKAQEKILLLMNNTCMLTRHHRLTSMNDVLIYLTVCIFKVFRLIPCIFRKLCLVSKLFLCTSKWNILTCHH